MCEFGAIVEFYTSPGLCEVPGSEVRETRIFVSLF